MKRTLLAASLLLSCAPARAAPGPWRQFAAILWHSDLPAASLALLPALGITAGRVFGERGAFDPHRFQQSVAPLRHAGLDIMVENVATDFYAPYHRWQGPERPVNAAFLALLARFRADREGQVWSRDPGLSDPRALAVIEARLSAHARGLEQHPALYLSLGDETGIGDLSAASDLDEAPASIAAWRATLRQRVGTVASLDRAWGTHWTKWNDAIPMRTDDAIDATGAVPAWMDFKSWTDRQFARDVALGTDAVHRADAAARAGIEGAQRPGWGGYNYPDLAPAVDVMEIGEVGVTTLIARGFNPNLIMLTTSASTGDAEALRLWRFVLLGGRGVVLWDPDHTIVDPSGKPEVRGDWLRTTLGPLSGPTGRRLLASTPITDRIGVLYSQASFRMRWLLDRRTEHARGLDWSRRSNDTDLGDSPWRNALIDLAASLGHLGRNPVWIDAAHIKRLDDLDTIILPQAIALPDATLAALRTFAARGGRLVADIEPGQWDDTGRRRATSPLASMVQRVTSFDTPALRTQIEPFAAVATATGPRGDVSLFRFDQDDTIAIQRDVPGPRQEAILTIGELRCPITLEATMPTILSATHKGACPTRAP